MSKAIQLTKREQAIKERSQHASRHKTVKDMLSRAMFKLARIDTRTANMEIFMQNHFENYYPRPAQFKNNEHDHSPLPATVSHHTPPEGIAAHKAS
jgi:hypothetical protein